MQQIKPMEASSGVISRICTAPLPDMVHRSEVHSPAVRKPWRQA